MVMLLQKGTINAEVEVEQLVADLQTQGVKVWVNNGQLHTRAAAGAITQPLRARIQQWKAELIALLSRVEHQSPASAILRRSRPANLPLSYAQQRLWFMDTLGSSTAYNIPFSIQWRGAMDLTALTKAISEIVRRHESLRTVFGVVAGETLPAENGAKGSEIGTVRQIICPATPAVLPVVDFTTLAPAEQQQRVRQLAVAEATRPFDLQRDTMLRTQVLRLGAEQYQLLFTMHHIAADGWSLGVLVQEMATLYQAFCQGQPSPLPELAIQYADFALWQRDYLQGAVLERQLTWWQGQLAGAPALLQLPTDHPRPAQPSYSGSAVTGVIDSALSEALRALSQRQGCTLYMTLLAAFQILLYRYTGQEEIVVGSPIANRNRAELEPMIGFFANTLALRSSLAGNPTFLELLAQVQQRVQAAYDHQELPFERLVESLQTERDLAYNPLVQVIFALQNMPMGDLTLPDFQLSPLTFEVQNTRFDLELHIRETADQLHFFCVYSRDLFAASTIERLVAHYQQLLRGIVANPTQSIATLPLLTDTERHQLLVEWNNTTTTYPKDKCIHHLFEEQAARTPDAIAVIRAADRKTEKQEDEQLYSSLLPVSPSSCLTYRQLDEQANQLAHHLQSLGVTTETLVGICVERSVEMVVGLLAILKAGGAYVPLDPSYPQERLAFMLQESATPVLLTQSHWVAHLPPTTAQIVCLDQLGTLLTQECRRKPVDAGNRSNNLAYVMYTSGSTGQPKGACVLHRNVVRLVKETDFMHLGNDEVFLPLASPAFDATTLELWGPLLNGGRIVLLPPTQPTLSEIAAAIKTYQVTSLWLTAGLFHLMVDEQLEALRPLRQLLAGGDVLSPTHVQRVRQAIPTCRLINGYGPTENTTFTCCYTIPPHWTAESAVPIGRPIANTQVYLLDAELQPVPIGVAGELYAGGDGVAQGYYQRPELTTEKFIANPFGAGQLYKTGDLCRWRADGDPSTGSGHCIEFLGRIDQQVKIRGFRIELGEIESVLSQHPAVQEAVVVVREDTPSAKRLVAYLVAQGQGTTASAPLTSADLRSYLQQKLPDYMLPTAFVLLDSLPLTPNGKIDRKALPRPEQQQQTQSTYVKPQTALQQQLVEIWQEELHLEQVGIHDNFFDLGGHSLLIVKIHSRLKASIAKALTIVDLFHYPTIQALCDYLEPAFPTRKEAQLPATRRQSVKQKDAVQPVATQQSIAIIGMAGRFPGADNIATLWQNLATGVEAVTFFSDEELAAAGVAPEQFKDPAYVKAGAVLSDIEHFDADFFGFSTREAELLDPQIRLFLECAWEALETAGCDPQTYPGAIGVYAGSSENTYLVNHLRPALDQNSWADFYQTLTTNGKDFLTTRVAYKLNLTGPAINVQTACSTSLVATHLACRSLLSGDCDVALAGGVSVHTPHRVGYRYEEGMIFAPDGHCRAFDVGSAGTIGSNGVGIVVLKRLADALADGDVIHAVIKGSAINNDGARKVGYTAPSVDGQMKAIRQALANAAVDPATIGYIETHGTGTKLGDPIELAALKEIFQAPISEAVQSGADRLVLGAVKTNFGHLDAAAGITGLIKTALALKHGLVPPTLHFTVPNPELGFPQQLFQINPTLMNWPAKDGPRRAGVSSFGIGGTNAHAILEEAPPPITAPQEADRTYHLLTLSAKTDAALHALAMRYADFLAPFTAAAQDVPLADLCYTTHVGRSHFDQRVSVVGASAQQLQEKLLAYGQEAVSTDDRASRTKLLKPPRPAPIAFLFTGQGAQYHGMGQILYETEPTFRATINQCDRILRDCLGRSLLELLYPAKTGALPTSDLLESHPCGQAVNFAIECALADLWRAWGIEPDFVLGHSLGDFAAAYSAGVISLEDGLRLVTARGQFMERAHGQMVAVMADEAKVLPFLAGVAEVAIAVINGPQSVVISGTHAAIQQVNARLQAAGIKTRPLAIPVAAHSPLLDPILDEFAATVRGLALSAPGLAVVSSMTGQLVQDELTDPAYWRQHLRNTVRFADGVRTLYERGCRTFIEIGPKPTLLGLVEQILDSEGAGQGEHGDHASPARVLLLPSLRENQDDWQQLLDSLGQLYMQGVTIDWHGFEQNYQRHKVELPTYPFQRRRYWIDAPRQTKAQKAEPPPQEGESWSDWLYGVAWQPHSVAYPQSSVLAMARHWLLFADEQGMSDLLAARLRQRGDAVTLVRAGAAYQQIDKQHFIIRPTEAADYRRLMGTLPNATGRITDVVHGWSLDSAATEQVCDLAKAAQQSYGTTLYLVQALLHEYATPPQLWLITRGAQAVQRAEQVTGFAAAGLWGMGKTIALEHPELHCVCLDLDENAAPATQSKALSALLVADTVPGDAATKTTTERLEARENQLALRSGQWYVPRLHSYESVKLASAANRSGVHKRFPIRANATYLITGGLGGLGLEIAQWLVERGASHLILMGRSQPTAEAQMKVARMQALGAQIRVAQADVREEAQVAAILATIAADYPLRGIIHAAGVLADASLLQQGWQQFDQVYAPKVYGAWHLHKLTRQMPLDFFVFFSSLAGLLGNRGQANHAAANASLDALAHYRQALGLPALSINWAGWLGVGTAVRLQEKGNQPSPWAGSGLGGYSPEQGVEVFAHLLDQPAPQIGCMRIDWRHYLDEQRRAMPFYRAFAPQAAAENQPQSRLQTAPTPAQTEQSAVAIYDQLLQASSPMRPALLLSQLQTEVMRLLRLGSPGQIDMQQGLIELGMDSLMAIELRNRLQKSLQIKIPAAKFLEGITLTGIVEFLLAQFQTEHDAAPPMIKNSVRNNEQGWEKLAAIQSESSLSKVKEIAL